MHCARFAVKADTGEQMNLLYARSSKPSKGRDNIQRRRPGILRHYAKAEIKLGPLVSCSELHENVFHGGAGR